MFVTVLRQALDRIEMIFENHGDPGKVEKWEVSLCSLEKAL